MCDAVAAELLVPLEAVRLAFDRSRPLEDEMRRLARRFKVSTLVTLRRIFDLGALTREAFWRAYDTEVERLRALGDTGGGGNFHDTEAVRVSRLFARAHHQHARRPDTLPRRIPDARDCQAPDLPGLRAVDRSSGLMAYLLDANIFIEAKQPTTAWSYRLRRWATSS